MRPSFVIDFNWLPYEYGDEIARTTFVDIFISVGSCCITELEDRTAKTIRKNARLSAYRLAHWFAENWWRLLWEPKKDTIDWRLAHQMGSAGGGYLWPDLTFVSDGEYMTIHAKPTLSSEEQSIRYLYGAVETIPVDEFEKSVQGFIDGVIGRVDNQAPGNDELKTLWHEVTQERHDSESGSRRKLEAMMGFDPDGAPDTILETLERMKTTYGDGAIEEMASSSMDNAVDDISFLWNIVRPKSIPLRIPHYDMIRRQLIIDRQSSILAWQRAESAARLVRKVWSIASGPISNKVLADLLDIPQAIIYQQDSVQPSSLSVGFRDNGNEDMMRVYIDRRSITSRRFALARLVGSLLAAGIKDRLLPVSQAHTQRQKFQRAFAQELLCPFSDLIGYFGDCATDDEAIEDAAESFEVSPLMIRTILVNKRIVSNEALLIT